VALEALRLLLLAHEQLVAVLLLALRDRAGAAGVLALRRPLAAILLAAVVELGLLLLGGLSGEAIAGIAEKANRQSPITNRRSKRRIAYLLGCAAA
jgi:hypothetical protein